MLSDLGLIDWADGWRGPAGLGVAPEAVATPSHCSVDVSAPAASLDSVAVNDCDVQVQQNLF